jgi:PAS domain-containing protein
MPPNGELTKCKQTTHAEPYGAGIDGIGLAAAIDQAAEAIVITDRDGSILYVNPAFTRMTGYSSQEAIGQNPRLMKSGRQDPAYYRSLWETIRAGGVWKGELDHRSLNIYTISVSSILYFQRKTTGSALISSKYW